MLELSSVFANFTGGKVELIIKYYVLAPILSFLLILLCIIALRALGPVNHPNRSVDASENICFQKKMDIT
ncbi:MAG: hypothetical protein UHD64_01430, partial [Bacteroidales bacterium]|nr:hypothetical protein [Bacteroidales bacterium]